MHRSLGIVDSAGVACFCRVKLVAAFALVGLLSVVAVDPARAVVGPVRLPYPVAAVTSGNDQIVAATYDYHREVRLMSYRWSGRLRGPILYRPGCGDGEETDAGLASVVLSPISGGLFTVETSPTEISSNFAHRSLSLQGASRRNLACGPFDYNPLSDPTAKVGAGRVLSATAHNPANGDIPESGVVAPATTDVADAITSTPLFTVPGAYHMYSIAPTRILLANGAGFSAVDASGTAIWQKSWPQIHEPWTLNASSGDNATLALGTEKGIELVRMSDGVSLASWTETHWSCACIAVHGNYVAWIARRRVYVRALNGTHPSILATIPRGLKAVTITAGPGGIVWAADKALRGNLWFASWTDVSRVTV